MAGKEHSQRASLKDLLASKEMSYAKLCDILQSGTMNVYADSWPVRICSCKGIYPAWTFDKWGRWCPDEAEMADYMENSRWRRHLLNTWERSVNLGRGSALDLCASLGITSIEGAEFFPFPLDEISIANMGLDSGTHRRMLLSLTINQEDMGKILSSREDATNLKIIERLTWELKIDPFSRDAASKVKTRLELHGIELDDETIRKRIFKLRDRKKETLIEKIALLGSSSFILGNVLLCPGRYRRLLWN